MQRLKRKLWWWSITIPLKVKAMLSAIIPESQKEPVSYDESEIKLSKCPEYFSYQYLNCEGLAKNEVNPLWDIVPQEAAYFNPVDVAVSALVCFNEYNSKGSERALNQFEKKYAFLKNYAVWDKKNGAFWIPYYLDYPKYGMRAPWVSGLTQALTLSVALRVKPEEEGFIEGLYQSLSVPIQNGGVQTQHPSGYPWIAEYPGDVPFVLNGQLSVLIALVEYHNYSGDKKAFNLFSKILAGILQDYSKYVFKIELRYCWTTNQLANIQYKGLHAFQLLHLYKLTQLEEVRRLALEWVEVVPWKAFFRFHSISGQDQERLKNYLEHLLQA